MSDKWMPEDSLHAWQRLQTVSETLRREVGRTLKADADLSDAEFTVLAHLAHLGGTSRPTECAESIGWDSSRLAHQLGRLERRGLIDRAPDAGGDRRSSMISLTAEGRRRHRRAVGPHLRAAKRWFADALTEQQLRAFDEALIALERHAATGARLQGEEALR